MKKSKNNTWNNDHFKLFDDCPLCQSLKRGEDSFDSATKNDLYYDAMEAIDQKKFNVAEGFLNQALKIDSNYVQTYIGLAHLYGAKRQKKKVHEAILMAFGKTKNLFLKWPRKMSWYELENRAYLRAIHYRADLFADAGEKEQAIELYRLLLKLNPNDNQGIRYLISGLYVGIDGKDINTLIDKGNQKQNWSTLEKLVAEQNKKHSFWKVPKNLK